MIVISARLELRPEARDRAVKVAADLVAATVAEEGCSAYRMSTDISEPSTLYIFEEWADGDALQSHLSSPHMARFMEAMPEILGGSVDVTRYEVSSSGPLF